MKIYIFEEYEIKLIAKLVLFENIRLINSHTVADI